MRCVQINETPLHTAVEWHREEGVQLLLERGADKEAKDNERARPRCRGALHHCSTANHLRPAPCTSSAPPSAALMRRCTCGPC